MIHVTEPSIDIRGHASHRGSAMRAIYFCRYLPGLHQLLPLLGQLPGPLWTDDAEVARACRRIAPAQPLHRVWPSKRWCVERLARRLEGDVFIGTNAHPQFFNRVRGPRVQCFHGVSSKGFAAQWRNTRYFDLCLLAGERMRRDFERAGLLDTVRCEVVGHIRGDRLARGDFDSAAFRRAHRLDAGAPTVLYAPTWSGLSSFNDHGLEIAQAVPPEWNFVAKLHPWTIRRRDAPAMVRAFTAWISARLRGALLPIDDDIHPAMAAADLMIGDRSSTCEEFLLLDRPILFFDHLTGRAGLDEQTRALVERGDWSGLHRCGPVVCSGPELRDALIHVHAHPAEHGDQRRRMRDFVFHQPDGRAAERAAVAIARLAGEMRGRVFGQRVFEASGAGVRED